MIPIGNHTTLAAGDSGQVSTSLAPKVFSLRRSNHSAEELRKQFTQFVGETFYGQMIKAMRSSVGKPAYFHGGRAEEVFQGQLDQKMAEHLTEATAAQIAEPLFERQFPHLARPSTPDTWDQLGQLSRR